MNTTSVDEVNTIVAAVQAATRAGLLSPYATPLAVAPDQLTGAAVNPPNFTTFPYANIGAEVDRRTSAAAHVPAPTAPAPLRPSVQFRHYGDERDDVCIPCVEPELFPSPLPKARHRAVIEKMFAAAFSTDPSKPPLIPREFQIHANFIVGYASKYRNIRLGMIRPTADGKTLGFLGGAMVQRGIWLVFEPIHAISIDQVSSVNVRVNQADAVFAEHLDTLHGEEALKVARFLYNTGPVTDRLLLLYASPECFDDSAERRTLWAQCLEQMEKNGSVTGIVMDEAHTVVSYGRHFRKPFATNLRHIVKMFWEKVPMVFCSATMDTATQNNLYRFLHPDSKARSFLPPDDPAHSDENVPSLFTHIQWANMQRRMINFKVIFTARPADLMKEEMKPYVLRYESDGYVCMLFSNHQSHATEKLLNFSENLLSELGVKADAMSITGDDGIMMKCFVVDVFAGKASSPYCLLAVLTATGAANMGISSDRCFLIILHGLPDSAIHFVQIFGRLHRGPRLYSDLPDLCSVYVNAETTMSLILRILNTEDPAERKSLLWAAMDSMRMIVLPDQCYHVESEARYERPGATEGRDPCGSHCPYCRGEHREFSGVVKRQTLTDVLSASAFHSGTRPLEDVLKVLTENKQRIWVKPKTRVTTGNIHALLHQLLAANLLAIHDARPDRSKPAKKGHIHLNWAIVTETVMTPCRPAYSVDAKWRLINCCS